MTATEAVFQYSTCANCLQDIKRQQLARGGYTPWYHTWTALTRCRTTFNPAKATPRESTDAS